MKSYSNDIVDTATLTSINTAQDLKIVKLQKDIQKLKLFGCLALANILAIYALISVYLPM